jgi:hypothetical protein
MKKSRRKDKSCWIEGGEMIRGQGKKGSNHDHALLKPKRAKKKLGLGTTLLNCLALYSQTGVSFSSALLLLLS